MEDEDIRSYSRDELREMRRLGLDRTDPNAPEYEVEEEFWQNARIVYPHGHESSVEILLDSNVLQWFRDQGEGHLARMNDVLRAYMEAHKGK